MRWGLVATLLILGGLFYFFFGFYSIQPIGAIPGGSTVLVLRNASTEPFFNSPDSHCLRTTGQVSLMCRGLAIRYAPIDRIVLRLPYWRFAYVISTGGTEYEK